jgi:hypothetical protein
MEFSPKVKAWCSFVWLSEKFFCQLVMNEQKRHLYGLAALLP